MAKITVDQIKKFNGACKNDFILDVRQLALWGEKTCVKEIETGENGVLYRFTLEYKEVHENYRKIGVIPVLTIDRMTPLHSGLYSSVMVKREEVGEMTSRKNAKLLQSLTADYTDEVIKRLISEVAA